MRINQRHHHKQAQTIQLALMQQTLTHQLVIPVVPVHPGVEDEVVEDAPGAAAKMQIRM